MSPPRPVLINALSAGNRSGTGRYAFELCRALARLDDDLEVCVLLEGDHPGRAELEAASPRLRVLAAPGGMSPMARVVWECRHIPRLARRRQAALFHGTAFTLPPGLASPAVVTLHDCAFLAVGDAIPLIKRLYYRLHFRYSARRADRVVVDSVATAAEASRRMALPEAKIRVVPLGVDARFFAPPGAGDAEALARRHGLGGPCILTYGTLEPRKNLPRLIEAYSRLAPETREGLPLVIAGRRGWMCDGLEALARRHGVGDQTRFVGYVDDALLPALLAGAAVFVCVSLYEGFGLPALEAMAAGAPVVASNTTAFPEVVGDGGLLVDPTDVGAIADGLTRLLGDRDLCAALSQRGARRAGAFTWAATAERMSDLYHEVIACAALPKTP